MVLDLPTLRCWTGFYDHFFFIILLKKSLERAGGKLLFQILLLLDIKGRKPPPRKRLNSEVRKGVNENFLDGEYER